MSVGAALELTGAKRVPVVLQSETSECGLACLAMIAAFHGLRVDLSTLRRRYAVTLKGLTLKTLMSIAEQIGFGCRSLRAEIADLSQAQLPAILHWDLNHFVVLTSVKYTLRGRRYTVHDPRRGRLHFDAATMSRHFTGVLIELIKNERFSAGSTSPKIRLSQLWSKLSGLGPALGNILLLSVILQAVSLVGPFYLQSAVDTAVPSFDRDLLFMLAIGFGGLAVLNLATTWLRSLILVSLGSALSYQVIVNLYGHLLRLPLAWFEKRHVGDIVSRFGSTQPISDLLSQGLVSALIDGVMGVITLALMFVYSPKLALIALSAWVLFATTKLLSLQVVRFRNIDAITAAARENTSFIETVRGAAAIKAFAQEGNRQRIWERLKADAVNAQIRLGRITSGFDAIGQFIMALERVIFVYVAISMAMTGDFTVGMIFAFQAYKQQFLDASTKLIDFAIRYRLLDVHLGRISDIALAEAEPRRGGDASTHEPIVGRIEVKGVGFRYGVGEPEILRLVNLRIEPGQTVALVGPSGGGKTTLLKIMIGLIEPTYGDVLVDGVPLKNLGNDHWRRRIGYVAQGDMLYAGSLAENISFFDAEIDMERVQTVAEMAAIHQTIQAMPMRYESLVGDMGSALSGGQVQRILLARALYHDPAILFIDEGTAHLDGKSEEQIFDALENLPITKVIAAHRSSLLGRADRIITVTPKAVFENHPPSQVHRESVLSASPLLGA